jgi:hypothetical protein
MRAWMSCSATSACRCRKTSPSGPYIGTHRLASLQPLAHHGDDLAVRSRLLLQRPGREQVKAGTQLGVGQVGVGAAAACPAGQTGRAHQHSKQALDGAEGSLGYL